MVDVVTKSPTDLTATTGAATVASDLFLTWDASAGDFRTMTRTEMLAALLVELNYTPADDADLAAVASDLAALDAAIVRRPLSANTTFYVRADGNDANSGLANTSGGAKRTLQGMINYLKRSVDFAGYAVTVQLDASTHAGFTLNGPFVGENSTDQFRILGDVATPANVVIQGTNANAVRILSADVVLSGFTIQTTGSGNGLFVSDQATVTHDNLRFGNCVEAMFLINGGAVLNAAGPTTVAGNASSFLHVTHNARVNFESQTVTFVGTPAFSTYVVGLNQASVSFASGTLVGDKTGGTLVHIDATLNLSSTTGKIFGTNSAPVIEAGGNIIYNPPQNTIYVRADGSDNNDGYANDSTRAFATIAAAIAWLQKRPYDAVYSRNPTIQVGAGTWTVSATLATIPNVDSVTLLGDATTPSNVILSLSGACVVASGVRTPWTVRGFRLISTGSYGLYASHGSMVYFREVEFGACAAGHMYADHGAQLEASNNYSIIGAAPYHVFLDLAGRCAIASTVTITGTPAFSGRFARVESGSMAQLRANWSGSATGQRYLVTGNSVINANGAGTSSLPGDSAGSLSTGGQYV